MTINAVIMDMAGTCVDYGSLAPIQAFLQLFAAQGIPLSDQQARQPMGTEKREHIRQLLAMPEVAKAWQHVKGQAPGPADVDALYDQFLPLQLQTIRERAHLIPGCLPLMAYCDSHNIAVGLNTGYNREMVNAMWPQLQQLGLRAASVVCATEVPKGRPFPHMCLQNALELSVASVQACVKVDDTLTGIEEGLAAGMWTVAVSHSGNAMGLDLEQWQALDNDQQQRLASQARASFKGRAHYVIDSIADLPRVLDSIQQGLTCGSRP